MGSDLSIPGGPAYGDKTNCCEECKPDDHCWTHHQRVVDAAPGGLSDYQRGYVDGFDAPANVKARAAPGGLGAIGHIDGAHNHNAEPVCSICGVGLRIWKQDVMELCDETKET